MPDKKSRESGSQALFWSREAAKPRAERIVVEPGILDGTMPEPARRPEAAAMTSIWLRPEPSQEQALQSLIRSVAAEQGTFPFAPHLTVCGAPGDPATLDAVTAYIKECGLLPLRVAKTAVTGAVITPFRAVFIEVENTPELRQFRERLRDILGRRR